MSTIQQSTTINWQPPLLPVRRFTVDEYQRLIAQGIVNDKENYELLRGLIVPKMTRNPPHDLALELADEHLRAVLPAGWRIRIQSAVLTDDSLHEPDLAVVRGHARSRRGRHPTAREVGLAVEVAEASLERDRGEKALLYAAAVIASYWIVNLVDQQIEAYTDPGGAAGQVRYQQQHLFAAHETVPLVLDGKEVAQLPVADFLP